MPVAVEAIPNNGSLEMQQNGMGITTKSFNNNDNWNFMFFESILKHTFIPTRNNEKLVMPALPCPWLATDITGSRYPINLHQHAMGGASAYS